MTRIFFLGLGHMGGGMAANLVAAGFDVHGFDINQKTLDRAVAAAAGVIKAPSTAVGAAAADIVMSSLPGPLQIRNAGLMEDGIIANMRPGTVWIDLSTNDLDTARLLAAEADRRGVQLVDAPVSGGPEGAAAGTLRVYVGADASLAAGLDSVFAAIGSSVDLLGAHGAGYSAKIAQVTLCYTQTIALVEALMLGVKGGVAPEKMLQLIQRSAGGSYVADVYGPEIVAGSYDESFTIQAAAKDMRLALEMAAAVAADLPFMARVAERYAEAERVYGAAAPHLLAAQITEHDNKLVFSEASRPRHTDPIGNDYDRNR